MIKSICNNCKKSEMKYKTLGLCRNCYNKKQYREKPNYKLRSITISKIWIKNNPEKVKQYQKNSEGKPWNRYRKLKANAKTRGLKLDITREQYVDMIRETPLCVYCYSNCLDNKFGYGLDRIDNDKGYSIDNVQFCCGDCNQLRSNKLTSEEMHLIWNYRRSKG